EPRPVRPRGMVAALDQNAVDALGDRGIAADDDRVPGLERLGGITLAGEVHDGRAAEAHVPFMDLAVLSLRSDDELRMRVDEAPLADFAGQPDLAVLVVDAARAVVGLRPGAGQRARHKNK